MKIIAPQLLHRHAVVAREIGVARKADPLHPDARMFRVAVGLVENQTLLLNLAQVAAVEILYSHCFHSGFRSGRDYSPLTVRRSGDFAEQRSKYSVSLRIFSAVSVSKK